MTRRRSGESRDDGGRHKDKRSNRREKKEQVCIQKGCFQTALLCSPILKLKLFCCCKGHSTRVEFERTAQENRREIRRIEQECSLKADEISDFPLKLFSAPVDVRFPLLSNCSSLLLSVAEVSFALLH